MTLVQFTGIRPLYEQFNYLVRYGQILEIVVENGYQKIFYLCDDFVVQSTLAIERNEWLGLHPMHMDDYLEIFVNLDELL